MPGTSADIRTDISLKTTDQRKIDVEFSKNIFHNIYFKNLEGLKEKSDIVLFNNDKWEQNPMKFCLDRYKEVGFYKIILLINDVGSMFNFKSENFKDFKIYAPPRREMMKILSYVD
jgi:hypothetical protein